MKLTAQRNISIELFEAAGGEDLILVGTMLDNEHLIKLEMTIHLADEQITRSRLDMIRSPFHVCRQVEGCAEALVGLRIQRGVLNEIAKRVGGRIGCSHLKEIATNIVYFAASYLARRRAGLDVVGVDSAHIPTEEKFRLTRTFLSGSCLAYSQTSPLALDESMGIRRLGQVHESPIALGEHEPSLGVVLRDRASRFGEKVYLRYRADGPSGGGEPVRLSFHDFGRGVFQIARNLIARDIRPGDRIAMISENRAEMLMFELAAMSIGAVSVPVYAGYPSPQISYVLRHARPRMVVVSGMHQLAKVERDRHPWVEAWYCMDVDAAARKWGAAEFAALTAPGGAMGDELESRIDDVRPDDLCMIMYTSGTTGPPKGVMLAHRNLISQQKALSLLWDVGENDVFLSYLPWHHSFGGLFERFMTLYNGCELGLDDSFGRDVDRLLENWRLFNPTLFFSVPRVHDMLLARCRQDPEAATAVFGGRLRFVFTAGASLPAHVAAAYARHSIPVLEGWGLTETSPCCTVTGGANLPQTGGGWRSGHVGWPIPGVSIRIDSDQEILVRGPNVMRGYLDDEDMTARVIDEDGWFHTGDLGEFSRDSGLRILGRRDGAFKLTTGEKVHPHRIESVLANESPYISTAVALGSGRDYVAALIFPDRARLLEWAAAQRFECPDFESLLEHPSVRELFVDEIARVNPLIEVKYHRVKRFVLVGRELSLERGEVTPSGKVCRERVCDGSRREIEGLFESVPGDSVIEIAAAEPQLARAAR
jgi:long-subunit acyl-CoA synthetase (AMP-forming)